MFALHSLVSGILIIIATHIDNVQCQGGNILNGPQTQVVAPDEIATFNCHARGNSVYWYINGRYADPQIFVPSGFTFTYNEIPHPHGELEEHNNTITVEARPSNNNTLITCTATGFIHGQQDYREGRLIIADSPLAPPIGLNVQLTDFDNLTFTFTLSWTAPYSLPEFPITGYTVTITNYSSGETFNEIFSAISNQTEYMYEFNTTGNECYRIDLSVLANNSIGEGESSMIHSGHPIIGEIGDIETAVTFLSNGTPHVWISFLAPSICSEYQSGVYNITIYTSDNESIVHQFGPTEYTQEHVNEQELIVKEIKNGFTLGEYYGINVTSESHGILDFRTIMFDAVFEPNLCRTASPETEMTDSTVTVMSEDCEQQIVVVGTAVGVLSTLLIGFLLMIIAILLFLLKQQRNKGNETDGSRRWFRQRRHSPQPRIRIESNNPIYEGAAIYETTPGESLKCLIPPVHSPDSAHHYVDQPPSLPPPRPQEPMDEIDAIKASLKQASLPQASEAENGDIYVAMGPSSYCTPIVSNKKNVAPKQIENASKDVRRGSAGVPECIAQVDNNFG